MMQEKVRSLIEQRIIEATRKQLALKLTTIAKTLGKPIIAQSFLGNLLPDTWDDRDDLIYDKDRIYGDADFGEIRDDGIRETQLGFAFDGLKFGINLAIHCLMYEQKVAELKATYNGYVVYTQMEGEIRGYAPFPAWEDAVNMFYDGAVSVDKKRQQEQKEAMKEERKRRFQQFWRSFKMLWGY